MVRRKTEHLYLPVCFTPDGAFLVSIDEANCLTMNNVKTGRLIYGYPLRMEVLSFAYTAAGRTLAIGTEDGKVHVFDFNPRTP